MLLGVVALPIVLLAMVQGEANPTKIPLKFVELVVGVVLLTVMEAIVLFCTFPLKALRLIP